MGEKHQSDGEAQANVLISGSALPLWNWALGLGKFWAP